MSFMKVHLLYSLNLVINVCFVLARLWIGLCHTQCVMGRIHTNRVSVQYD